jgi:hypothetical protein
MLRHSAQLEGQISQMATTWQAILLLLVVITLAGPQTALGVPTADLVSALCSAATTAFAARTQQPSS